MTRDAEKPVYQILIREQPLPFGNTSMRLTSQIDTKGVAYRSHGAIVLGVAAILSVTGCNTTVEKIIPTTIPTEQSVAGLSPDGTVSMSEIFVGGSGGGKGVLSYRGKKYPFLLVGSVVGPGGLSKLKATGEVYKLNDVLEFPGVYAQGTGAVGLETTGASDLWLENKGGVVMHLTGTQAGVTLSLGRDEILIKMRR